MQPRLLIVDDNDDFRKNLKDYIESHELKIEIYEAYTGEMALAKSSCIKPDIVLMDISLPHGNGLAAARYIKEDHPACDIIVLTMFDVEEFKNNAKKIEVRDFIGKNDLYEKLLPSIKKCLKEKNQEVPYGQV